MRIPNDSFNRLGRTATDRLRRDSVPTSAGGPSRCAHKAWR